MRLSVIATLAVCALAPQAARAQSSIGAATTVEAHGLRLSETARLHVGGNVDLRYDSNPTYLAVNPVGDMALRVRATTGLYQPGDRLELRLNVNADWTQYLGVQNAATRALSAFQAQVDAGALFNKDGWATPYLANQFWRIVQPA